MNARQGLFRAAAVGALALAIILLAACGAPRARGTHPTVPPSATATTTAAPTTLKVLLFGGSSSLATSQYHYAPFQMTVQRAPSIERLYQSVFKLPAPYSGWCPEMDGSGYELSFMQGSTLVMKVILSRGCPYAAISNPAECRSYDDAFIAQLAAILGVSVKNLDDATGLGNLAGSKGQIAPAAPPPPVLTPPHCGVQFSAG